MASNLEKLMVKGFVSMIDFLTIIIILTLLLPSASFWRKFKSFCLENISNLIYKFLQDNPNLKILQNFHTNLMHFQEKMTHLFSSKRRRLTEKLLIIILSSRGIKNVIMLLAEFFYIITVEVQ